MRIYFIFITLISVLFCTECFSEPSPLSIDNKIKRRVSDKYLIAAHEAISHHLSKEDVRLAVLQATFNNKKIRWLLEEDGNDYLIVRWDYGRDVILTKIEYNEKYVQMKYIDGGIGFDCVKNIEGICYWNENKDYYSYMKRLKQNLIRYIAAQQ